MKANALFPYVSGGLHFEGVKFIAISPTKSLSRDMYFGLWRNITVGKNSEYICFALAA